MAKTQKDILIQVFSLDQETDKAISVTVRSAQLGVKQVWLPKSQILVCGPGGEFPYSGGDIHIEMPMWLASANSLS